MLRGVNKQIIEITNTDSNIFEKVVLYIRPEYTQTSDEKIEKKAKIFISSLGEDKVEQRPNKRKYNLKLKYLILPICLTISALIVLLVKSMFF